MQDVHERRHPAELFTADGAASVFLHYVRDQKAREITSVIFEQVPTHSPQTGNLVFINTVNSANSSELSDEFLSYRDQIRRMLGLLDGRSEGRFAYQLWFVPDSAGWPDAPGYSDFDWNSRYIQAGGSAERLSVEIQRVEDGELRHYVVGRAHDVDEPLTETVNVAGTDHPVHPAEVFDADEATDVFFHYFRDSGTVPDGYALRYLDLS